MIRTPFLLHGGTTGTNDALLDTLLLIAPVLLVGVLWFVMRLVDSGAPPDDSTPPPHDSEPI